MTATACAADAYASHPADRTVVWAAVAEPGHLVDYTHECRAHQIESVELGPAVMPGCRVAAVIPGIRNLTEV